MLYSLPVLALLLFSVAGGSASEQPNVLFICIDDLRPELHCYGVDYIHSPNIDALAAEGVRFTHHYVQAPTCGASRFALLTGTYGPYGNGALFARGKEISKDPKATTPSLPAWFRQHGYQTTAIGKVSHHCGGLGGPDWNDPEQVEMPLSWDRNLMPSGPWQHPRGIMHGLANGEIREKSGKMAVFQSFDGPDTSYPDGLITDAALSELKAMATANKPFFLAVGLIRPHLPFGAPAAYMKHYRNVELPAIPHPVKPDWKTTWINSSEFMKYNRWDRDPREDQEFATEVRRHYAACVSYADAQVGRIMEQLTKLGCAENAIVVIWGDHGWHLGEHAVWGKHTLFEESLHAPLIIRAPTPLSGPVVSPAVVETLSIYPTLCALAGLDAPDGLDGKSFADQLTKPGPNDGAAISYKNNAYTVRTATHRLIYHSPDYAELYDHTSEAGETANIAEQHPELVAELTAILRQRLGDRIDK